jgi:hypothetical protein
MGRVESETARPLDNAGLNLSLTYTPAVLNFGEWQYAPTASVNGAVTTSSPGEHRRFAGLQATHSLSRSLPLGEGHSLSFNVSQSAGTLAEWGGDTPMTRALAHAGSVFWQSFGDNASQTFAGLSLSDSRSWGASEGRFQMVNLQLTRRTQLSRTSSWSANITTQATRNEASDIDPFTGLLRLQAPGWQHFHTGTVSYENQRVFGVPRLRLTVLLSANSQQLDRRAAGDIDAPIERISESFESRLDYTVGRLDLRLSARQARVEGRPVSSVFVRAQRRF